MAYALPSEWITTEGGPLLLLQADLLPFWDGINQSASFRAVDAEFRWSNQPYATDYDRACDVKGAVGLISVGVGFGLVLGEEPLRTAWMQSSSASGGIIVRLVTAENENDAARALNESSASMQWRREPLMLAIDDEAMVLFDAAEPGLELLDRRLHFALSKGSYTVETCLFSPGVETTMLLHRLVMQVTPTGGELSSQP